MGIIFDIVLDAIIDTALLVPFLLITYLVMEWIEQRFICSRRRNKN